MVGSKRITWSNRPDYAGIDELGHLETNNDIAIEFKNVCFRYPNTDFDALSNINIKLRKGESYLIVGKNGAGKSTFIKLLCRFYSPTSGTIALNDKDILEYDRAAYLSLLSVLFQDSKPLYLTIEENVSSMEAPNDMAFVNAVSDADLSDRIRLLPDKERTSYGKAFDEHGAEFSGGEAQKMMIAKTLYKECPVKIFDEPTAGLDAVAEHSIYENIRRVSMNGLLIWVTHRLSTGVGSSNILVFSEGKIVETGDHQQLMKRNGVYASLFRMQATLYVGET